ncbi:MAG TPA: AAA family ATPase, partial [Alphaproteobacteria bacterium]|nr:AAA family ATPase [Alphaproteobacteria bacterium]
MSEAAVKQGPPEMVHPGTEAPAEPNLSVAAEPSYQEARQVPRISIHAFCISPETGAVLQRAADDRRVARAHVTVMMGGVEAGIAHYTDKPTPNLILVETRGNRQAVLDDLSRLSQYCDPGTKVIVLGAVNDIQLYRELMRRGISEYMVAPFTPVGIIDTISMLYGDPEQAPIGRVMAFIGAKGGVGSSTIAHNVAWALAEQFEDEATIVDFDLPFGTAGLNFNQEHGQGLLEAITAPERLDHMLLERLLTHCSDRLSLFTAPAALERDAELSTEVCETVLDVVRGSVPCVIVDLPHVWTSWTRHVLQQADDIVITATPELASLRNAKNIFDLLKAARPNDAPARLVINQVGMGKRPEIPLKDFAEAIGIEPVLVLPFDPQLF